MKTIQDILNAVYRDESGAVLAGVESAQYVLNAVYDESAAALRISGDFGEGGGGDYTPSGATHTTTPINLETTDLNETHVVNLAGAAVLNLPVVTGDSAWSFIDVVKKGAGALDIVRGAGATIYTIEGSGAILRLNTTETFASLRLQLISATEWVVMGYPYGTVEIVA